MDQHAARNTIPQNALTPQASNFVVYDKWKATNTSIFLTKRKQQGTKLLRVNTHTHTHTKKLNNKTPKQTIVTNDSLWKAINLPPRIRMPKGTGKLYIVSIYVSQRQTMRLSDEWQLKFL